MGHQRLDEEALTPDASCADRATGNGPMGQPLLPALTPGLPQGKAVIMKITFLGGGALRLLGAVDLVLTDSDTFREPHLFFMDLDAARAGVVAQLAAKMPSARLNRPRTGAGSDLDAALEGADFVYCCIRVGGVTALERDKRIAASYGYHGHDDFGPSGVMLTARTVPVVIDIAARMERLCPKAWLLLFTNPIPTLVDAVVRYTSVRSVGLCDGVYNFAWDVDALFEVGVPCDDLRYRGGGLNHLSWITPDATVRDRRVMDMVWEQWDDLPRRRNAGRCGWERLAPLVRLDGVMPLNNGHQTHYYCHDELAAEMAEYFAKTPSGQLRSARQDLAAAQAAELAARPSIDGFWEQPPLEGCGPGPFGNVGVHLMRSICKGDGAELIVTTPNRGHIVGLMEDAPVEAPVRVWRDRLEPVEIDSVPPHQKGLCNAVAWHQRLNVDAAVRGDRDQLYRALVAEPTIRSQERPRPMFGELWAAHQQGRSD